MRPRGKLFCEKFDEKFTWAMREGLKFFGNYSAEIGIIALLR